MARSTKEAANGSMSRLVFTLTVSLLTIIQSSWAFSPSSSSLWQARQELRHYMPGIVSTPSTTSTNRRNDRTKCHLTVPFVDDYTASLVSNVIEQLPPPLNEYPTLVGLGALGLVGAASLLALLLPPARLLSNQALEEIVQDTYIGQQLKQQQLKQQQNLSLTCVYKASRDGWSATAFHDKVDTLGSGIVAAQPAFGGGGGRVFGGFNPTGWRSTDDYTTATTAFLWCSTKSPGRGGRQIQKYKILPSSPAIFDYATAGPCFGASDLVIGPPKAAILGGFAGPDMEDRNVNAGSLRTANSLPGQAYETDKNWPVRGYRVPLKEVEVYCLTPTK